MSQDLPQSPEETEERHPEALVLLDARGRVRFLNADRGEFLGFHSKHLENKIFTECLHPDDQAAACFAMDELKATGPVQFDGRILIDGEMSPLLSLQVWEGVGGRCVLLRLPTALTLDFDRRLLEVQKLEGLGVLAGGIAHDFNNILAAILGNAEFLHEELDDDELLDAVQDVITAAERSRELIDQLLSYAGNSEAKKDLLNLNDLTQEMSRLLRAATPQTIVYQFDFSEIPPMILGESGQIRQVVMNLIVNAGDAIGDDVGAISISTGQMRVSEDMIASAHGARSLDPRRTYAYVQVEDTGCGMDEQTMRRIFQPFFTTKVTGRGLGLAGVLNVVGSHGGGTFVASAVDEGTTFRVIFPAQEGVVTEKRETVLETPANLEGMKVLVVDDDEMVRTVIRRILTKRGIHVLDAANGLEGIEVFIQHIDDVKCVLLDQTMPYIHGVDVYREMAAMREDIPVLMVSGHSEDELRPRLEGTGIMGLLQKPFTASNLWRAVLPLLLIGEDEEGAEGGGS